MNIVDDNYLLKENKVFSKTLLQFIYCLFLLSIVLSAVFVNFSVLNASTRAGTVIENTARVVYTDQNDIVYQALSNTVTVRVSAVPGVDISPGTTLVFNSIETFSLAHTITNTGNIADYINLDLDINQEWDYNIYIDLNNNKSIDKQDRLLLDNNGDGYFDTGLIEPKDKVHILIEVTPDRSLLDGLKEDINVNVFSSIDLEIKAEAINVVSINNNTPYIEIKQSPETVYSEQSYKYTIFYKNQGGNPLTNVVIENILPPELVHISSEGNGNFITDGTTKKIVWTVDELLAGESGSFEVTVSAVNKNNVIYTLINKATMYSDQTDIISDKTTTEIVPVTPNKLTIEVNPKIIKGDGESTALFTVNVFDILGRNVPDGTRVTFETKAGVFIESGNKYYTGYTKDGIVTAELLSPVLYGDNEINNLVTVTASDNGDNKVSESVIITFIPGGIAGEIINEKHELPESGIKVSLMDKNGTDLIDVANNPTYTNSDGRYFLTAPEINEYIVVFEIPEVGEVRELVNVTELEGAVFYPSEMLSGWVRSGQDYNIANPLENLKVSLYDISDSKLEDPIKTTYTDQNGNYIFSDLNIQSFPKRYIITAEKEINGISYKSRETITFTSRGQFKINKILNIFSTGRVLDEKTEEPVESAEVTLVYAEGNNAGDPVELPDQGNPVYTNSQGEYIIFPPAGSYKIRVSAGGYIEYQSDTIVTSGEPITNVIHLSSETIGGINLSKIVDKKEVRPNEKVTYQISFENTKSETIENLILKDELPNDIMIEPDNLPSGLVYDSDNHRLSFEIGALDSGQGQEFNFTGTVKEETEDGTNLNNRVWVEDKVSHSVYALANAKSRVIRKAEISISHFADKPSYKVGEIVNYTIKIKNEPDQGFQYTIYDLIISGVLPPGFKFIENSSVINGEKVDDPTITDSTLRWNYTSLSSGEELEIKYKVKITPAGKAKQAESKAYLEAKTNQAIEFTEGPALSIVNVLGPMFTEKAGIFGKIFIDSNQDGLQTEGERVIEKAKIILNNGTIITADQNGDYSYNLPPGTYLMAIAPESLYRINRYLDKKGLKIADIFKNKFYLDLQPGALGHLDFPIPVSEKAKTEKEVKLEIKTPDYINTTGIKTEEIDIEISISNLIENEDDIYQLYLFDLSASPGININFKNQEFPLKIDGVEKNKKISLSCEVSSNIEKSTVFFIGAALYKKDSNKKETQYLVTKNIERIEIRKVAYSNEDNNKDIILPAAGAILNRKHNNVKVKGQIDDQIQLYVNSHLVDNNKIGKTVIDNKEEFKELTFISVPFQKGENEIKVLFKDKDGKKEIKRVTYLAEKAKNIEIAYPSVSLSGQDSIELPIFVSLTDQDNIPCSNYGKLQTEVTKGNYKNTDKEKVENTLIEEGLYNTNIFVNSYNNLVELAVSSNEVSKIFTINLPYQEESSNLSGLLQVKGTLNSGIEIKTFLKNNLANDKNIIFHYDSKNTYSDNYFNTNEKEDNLYDYYGDQSSNINNYASSTGIFAAIEGSNFYAMYGDMNTNFADRKILNLNRNLTGFKFMGEGNNNKFELYLAKDNKVQVQEDIIPEGITGYYFLNNKEIIPGSEIVVLRSQDQDGTLIEEKKFYRNIDYIINYQEGMLMFNKPINRYGENFRENVIIVKYQILSSNNSDQYSGLNLKLLSDENSKVGFTVINKSGSQEETVYGLSGKFNMSPKNKFEFETAFDKNQNSALRSYLSVGSIPQTEIDIQYSQQDKYFKKPGAKKSDAATSEIKGNINYEIDANKLIELGYKKLNNINESLTREEHFASLTFNEGDKKKGAVGLYQIQVSEADSNDSLLYLMGEKRFSVNKNMEITLMNKFLLDGNEKLVRTPASRISLNYNYSKNVRINTSWEKKYTSGPNSLLRFNLDYKPWEQLKLFTGYKHPLGNGDSEEDRIINYGVSNTFELTPNTKLDLSAQNVTNLGEEKEETFSLSGQLAYTQDSIEASLKHEVKNGSKSNSAVSTLKVQGDINKDSSIQFEYNSYDGKYFKDNDFNLNSELKATWVYRPRDNNLINGFTTVKVKDFSENQEDNETDKIVRTFSSDWFYNYNKKVELGFKVGYQSISEVTSHDNQINSINNDVIVPQLKLSYEFNNNNFIELFNRWWINKDNNESGYSVQYRHELNRNISLVAGFNSEDLSVKEIDNKSWQKGSYFQAIYTKKF